MKLSKPLSLGLTAVAMFVAMGSVVSGARAAAEAILIDPIKETVTANAGDIKSLILKIQNNTAEIKDFTVTFKEFTVDDSGSPTELTTPTTANPAAWFGTDSAAFTLAKAASKDVKVTVTVPKNTTAQGYYVTAITTISGQQSGGSNQTKQQLQTLYSVVIGSPTEKMELSQIVPTTKDITLVLHNPGNVHTTVSGKIDLMLNGSVAETYSVDSVNVFPGKDRRVTIAIDALDFETKAYTARVSLAYGHDNKILTASQPLDKSTLQSSSAQSVTVKNTATVVNSKNNDILVYSVVIAGVLLIGVGIFLVVRKK